MDSVNTAVEEEVSTERRRLKERSWETREGEDSEREGWQLERRRDI